MSPENRNDLEFIVTCLRAQADGIEALLKSDQPAIGFTENETVEATLLLAIGGMETAKALLVMNATAQQLKRRR